MHRALNQNLILQYYGSKEQIIKRKAILNWLRTIMHALKDVKFCTEMVVKLLYLSDNKIPPAYEKQQLILTHFSS